MATPQGSGPATAPAPLEEAVRRVGDRWTLLLVDALLVGPQRFGDLLDALDGLAPNVLSKRLRALEADGLVVARPYQDRPVRHEYQLTGAGRELAGALRLLAQWGATRGGHVDDAPLHHRACGTTVEPRWYCATCDVLVDDIDTDDLRYV